MDTDGYWSDPERLRALMGALVLIAIVMWLEGRVERLLEHFVWWRP